MAVRVIRELTSAREYVELVRATPELRQLPRGDGHPVVVVPGFLGSDGSTRLLRSYLSSVGYRASTWGQGRNYGSLQLFDDFVERVVGRAARAGEPVSLVGWSLGGIATRWAAVNVPESVRQVITLGSPFRRDPRTQAIWPLYAAVSGMKRSDFTDDMLASVVETPPVPTTSIVSRDDAIVDPAEGYQPPSATSETIEIRGSHSGLARNAEAWRIVADRLSRPIGAWTPYAAPADSVPG